MKALIVFLAVGLACASLVYLILLRPAPDGGAAETADGSSSSNSGGSLFSSFVGGGNTGAPSSSSASMDREQGHFTNKYRLQFELPWRHKKRAASSSSSSSSSASASTSDAGSPSAHSGHSDAHLHNRSSQFSSPGSAHNRFLPHEVLPLKVEHVGHRWADQPQPIEKTTYWYMNREIRDKLAGYRKDELLALDSILKRSGQVDSGFGRASVRNFLSEFHLHHPEIDVGIARRSSSSVAAAGAWRPTNSPPVASRKFKRVNPDSNELDELVKKDQQHARFSDIVRERAEDQRQQTSNELRAEKHEIQNVARRLRALNNLAKLSPGAKRLQQELREQLGELQSKIDTHDRKELHGHDPRKSQLSPGSPPYRWNSDVHAVAKHHQREPQHPINKVVDGDEE